jgi:hypothetical protein
MGEPAGHPFRGNQWTKGGGPVRFSSDSLSEDDVKDFTKRRFGEAYSREDMAKMAGALPGSEVSIVDSELSSSSLEVNITFMGDDGFPIGSARRTIYHDTVENNEIEFQKGFRGKGLGLQVFEQQVDELSKRGYKTIEAQCAGFPASADQGIQNGYYTWAKFGYNGEVEGPNGWTTVHELMKTPDGSAWWRANGHEFNGVFSLDPGSDSRRVFDEYRRLKGSR